MHFLFLGKGTARQVFKALALATVAERLLEMRFGKRHIAGTPSLN